MIQRVAHILTKRGNSYFNEPESEEIYADIAKYKWDS